MGSRGRARWSAKALRGVRDARVEERARLDSSASSRRIEGFARNIVASTSSTCAGDSRERGQRCRAVRERIRGPRRGKPRDVIRTRSPIQSDRTSPSPVVAPSTDILPAASRVPVANEDASTVEISLGHSVPLRCRARGRGQRKRTCDEDVYSTAITRSRLRAPEMRRPRAPLVCGARVVRADKSSARSGPATKAPPRVWLGTRRHRNQVTSHHVEN